MRVREATNKFARDVMGAVIENRDDGASRIERDGQSWFRVAVTPKTIMTSLGPANYRRARYRRGASGASPVPVDESLGLVDDYLSRPAAELGLLMMGHCTAREAAAFFAKTGRALETALDERNLPHNLKVAGSNPAPATKKPLKTFVFSRVFLWPTENNLGAECDLEGRRRTHDVRPAKALPAAQEPKADGSVANLT